jgi:magnesium-transporting ATPase (P-type)
MLNRDMLNRDMLDRRMEAPHSKSPTEVLAELGSTERGLDSGEAAARLARYGPNALPEAKPRHPLARIAAQFHNVLIYFLLASALGAAILGHAIDAGAIIAVVLVNAFVGFIQEGKAEKALAAMRRMIAPQASVLRTAGA